MAKKGIIEQVAPEMELYRPVHKAGVLDALKDYCRTHRTPKVRKQGITGRLRPENRL